MKERKNMNMQNQDWRDWVHPDHLQTLRQIEDEADAELDGPIDDEGDGPSGFDFRQDMGEFRIRPFRTS